MKTTLLSISDRPDDLEFATEVAKAADLRLISVPNSTEARKRCTKPDHDTVFFVDVSTPELFTEFEKNFSEMIGEDKSKINTNFVHLIGFETIETIQSLAKSNIFGHYILRKYGEPKDAGSYYGRIVKGLAVQPGFGLAHLVSSQASIRIIKLGHSDEKSKILASLMEFLNNETTFNDRMANIIVTAVDELVMNAIYDAPVSPEGDQELKSTSRDTPIPLTGRRSVELQMGYDGEYFAFTAIDRFGSLNKRKLLSHLFNSRSEYQLDASIAGAGLGLATTFKTGGSLVFLSEPEVRSEATVFFKRAPSFKEFRNQFRFISVHVAAE